MTLEEWATIVAFINDAHPNHKPYGSIFVEGTYHTVAEFDPAEMTAAVSAYLAEGNDFPPNVGHLIQRVRRINETAAPDFDEAWLAIMSAVRSTGSWGTPEFGAPEIRRLVDLLGGWHSFCATEEAELPVIRAQARRMYEEMTNRIEVERAKDKLPMIKGRSVGQIGGGS